MKQSPSEEGKEKKIQLLVDPINKIATIPKDQNRNSWVDYKFIAFESEGMITLCKEDIKLEGHLYGKAEEHTSIIIEKLLNEVLQDNYDKLELRHSHIVQSLSAAKDLIKQYAAEKKELESRLQELEKSENQIEEAKREAWESGCSAMRQTANTEVNMLCGINLECENPQNPYAKPSK